MPRKNPGKIAEFSRFSSIQTALRGAGRARMVRPHKCTKSAENLPRQAFRHLRGPLAPLPIRGQVGQTVGAGSGCRYLFAVENREMLLILAIVEP
jgi:hypothetical protein